MHFGHHVFVEVSECMLTSGGHRFCPNYQNSDTDRITHNYGSESEAFEFYAFENVTDPAVSEFGALEVLS